MVDVGAHHGDAFAPYLASGWQVHAFEPDATNRRELVSRFGDSAELEVVAAAVSNSSGTLPIYRSEESTGISSLAPFTEGHRPAGQVPVTTISEYVGDGRLTAIDFLKIDAEGYDLFVLEGVPWQLLTPEVILAEFEDFKTESLGYRWTDLAKLLLGHGYRVLVSEWYPIERYGGEHRWRRLAEYPCELRDQQAWGNLIAVRPERRRSLRRVARAERLKAKLFWWALGARGRVRAVRRG